MKTVHRTVALILALVMLVSFAACKGANSDNSKLESLYKIHVGGIYDSENNTLDLEALSNSFGKKPEEIQLGDCEVTKFALGNQDRIIAQTLEDGSINLSNSLLRRVTVRNGGMEKFTVRINHDLHVSVDEVEFAAISALVAEVMSVDLRTIEATDNMLVKRNHALHIRIEHEDKYLELSAAGSDNQDLAVYFVGEDGEEYEFTIEQWTDSTNAPTGARVIIGSNDWPIMVSPIDAILVKELVKEVES